MTRFYTKKPDTNQGEIVRGLRDVPGLSVAPTHRLGDGFPDILIGGLKPCPFCRNRFPQNTLVEIKWLDGGLTPDEKDFHGGWRGQIGIAHTLEEALREAGVKA